ncbi:hypothetical protein OHA77_33495 [Streptosporangium sp. NBC_01639]|uniref:hypothetical protein n=1 Tax=Streptosporangium sp. NBC_01639 TaxID=2975948 RepID=UPI00386A5FDE|nr:hypothetical protein OHA77_33495 [Streptosporangium sp. NBC_01639]
MGRVVIIYHYGVRVLEMINRKGLAGDVDRADRLPTVQRLTSTQMLHVFFTPTAEEIA